MTAVIAEAGFLLLLCLFLSVETWFLWDSALVCLDFLAHFTVPEFNWCKYLKWWHCAETGDCWDLRKSWRLLTHQYSYLMKGLRFWLHYLRLRFITLLIVSIFLTVPVFISDYIIDLSRATHLLLPYICILPYIILPYLLLCLWFLLSSLCDLHSVHPPYFVIIVCPVLSWLDLVAQFNSQSTSTPTLSFPSPICGFMLHWISIQMCHHLCAGVDNSKHL